MGRRNIDHENTWQFYYPAMTEFGKLRLQDSTLTANERMMINSNIAAILGLSGDMEHVDFYIQASLEAYEDPNALRGTKTIGPVMGEKQLRKRTKGNEDKNCAL